jgi:hypothetical protein
MKQYLTPEQTAKLIELGFEKPNGSHRYWRGNELVINNNYSIGELIEMLPEDIEDKYNRGVWYFRNITGISVYYSREERMYWTDLYISCLNEELIDNLYDMIVKLKEEGVI